MGGREVTCLKVSNHLLMSFGSAQASACAQSVTLQANNPERHKSAVLSPYCLVQTDAN